MCIMSYTSEYNGLYKCEEIYGLTCAFSRARKKPTYTPVYTTKTGCEFISRILFLSWLPK